MQQRNEDFVQRFAEDRRLVGRPAGVGRKIDRIAAHGDRGDGENRKLLDRIVIAGVIAIRAFVAIIGERDFAFEHDLGFRRHFERLAHAIGQLHARAAQQSRELIFRQRVRHRRHRGEDRSRIGAEHCRGGQGR